MSSGFFVQTPVLRSAAGQFAVEGDRLAQALSTLQARLDSLGAPWGNDKQGRAWGASYEPHRPTIENALRLLAQGLDSVHECLIAAAENHEGCDRANTIVQP
ncbi:MAG: hypothetical protein M3042_08990 [Actinomycetota bacterium]|nr:hypothetical protein [Actinomycetota bacterium]